MTVCVLVAVDDDASFISAEMNGVTGVATGSDKAILVIEPSSFSDDALRYVLAHEYHHSWWASHQEETVQWDLLTSLIAEGMADAFATKLHPTQRGPWTGAIAPAELDRLWEQIKPDLDSENFGRIDQVMFGDGVGLPQWTGYTLGYEIVVDYLDRHPSADIIDLLDLTSEELLAGTRFGAEE